MNFETLSVTRRGVGNHVAVVCLDRPKKGNAMNAKFWTEYRECFDRIARDTTVRAVCVVAEGKHFSVGLDLSSPPSSMTTDDEDSDLARKSYRLRSHILSLQDSFTAMERCPQPVLVAVHGAAIGGAIDLCCCADIRLASRDAWFCIK